MKPDELPPEENKYKLKPQRELKSRFLTQQQQRQEAADKLLQSEKPQAVTEPFHNKNRTQCERVCDFKGKMRTSLQHGDIES